MVFNVPISQALKVQLPVRKRIATSNLLKNPTEKLSVEEVAEEQYLIH